jgi:hypothetical protein
VSKKLFTSKEVLELRKNIHVKAVSDKAITYQDTFKEEAVLNYLNGKCAKAIFQEAGFDITVLGSKRVSSCIKRWTIAYKKDGVLGLKDTRSTNSGRPLERELSDKEVIHRLEAQNLLLKAENELLKKIKKIERGW